MQFLVILKGLLIIAVDDLIRYQNMGADIPFYFTAVKSVVKDLIVKVN